MKKIITYCLLVTTLLSSCKIQYGFNVGDVGAAKTATVTLFVNNAGLANPNLPLKITEKLKDLILSQSKLTLLTENADVQFSGVITGYNITPVAVQANETAGLNRLTISVKVDYVNKLDEKTNFSQSFSRFADYDSGLELSSVEEQLMDEINRQLAQDIFDRAFSNW